jgi:hypothetical protein
VAFERIVASQEAAVAKMEELGDSQGAEMARTFLETCRDSFRLAAEHLNRLLELNRDTGSGMAPDEDGTT